METSYLDLAFRASQIEAICEDKDLVRAIGVIHDICKHQWLHNNQIEENYLITLTTLVEIGEKRYLTK